VQFYRLCDDFTEVIIYLMLIFSPWAFGTTQPWSIWTMNAGGYCLGLFLLAKLFIRRFKGYLPPRLDDAPGTEGDKAKNFITSRGITAPMAILTAALLLYSFIAAANARSTYDAQGLSFTPHLHWLPASFDSARSWFTPTSGHGFLSYLAMACAFWAVWDWLLGISTGEERARRGKAAFEGRNSGPLIPARLRRLLWVLSVSGGLLAMESIAQRLEGSGKLLFVIKPRVNPEGETQFGPYAYRANASQYFNLLWPVCLGFWWTLQRARPAGTRHHLLLFCATLMAACPIISTSRGGALITVGILLAATLFLAASYFFLPSRRRDDKGSRRWTLSLLALFFIAVLATGFSFGWKALKPRMAKIAEGFEDREQMYDFARPMARDYPWYGTGPGTFDPLFQLYRKSPDTYWPAQLHNDWLETRITFGWVGSALIALALMTVLARWFVRGGGIHGGRRFMVLTWLALAGCLVHARFDFPFQIYSIEFLFLVLCAMVFTLSRRT
jgi:O-antigen ligase